MFVNKITIFLITIVVSFTAFADPVPYIFTDGQPAVAAQLNANFDTLSTQISQLQAQLAALQPQAALTAIVGTYDVVGLSGLVESTTGHAGVAHVKSKGAFTFNANGTASASFNSLEWGLNINKSVIAFCLPPSCGSTNNGSYITTNVDPGGGSGVITGTYTVSGQTVTLTLNDGEGPINFEGTLSANGGSLIFSSISSVNDLGIFVGLKR